MTRDVRLGAIYIEADIQGVGVNGMVKGEKVTGVSLGKYCKKQ